MKSNKTLINSTPKQKVVGVFEKVSFLEYGIHDITAKIDTGAYTGAFHCTNIKLKDENGKKVLYFSPFDHPEIIKYTEDFLVRYVKSSNGGQEKRFLIETVVELAGNSYPILLTLADRSEMKSQVLIGRRFLRAHNLLVDVSVLNQ